MSDDALRRRLIDRVLGSPDPDRERALIEALREEPELLAEYRRLRAAWDALGELPAHEPPEGARARAAGALEEAMGADSRPGRPIAWLRMAAAILLFVSGVAVGVWLERDGRPIPGPDAPALVEGDDRPRYALLIRSFERPGDVDASHAAMTDWARDLWSQERLVWAELLFPASAVRIGASEEPGDPIGLLFMIRAENRAAALRVARQAPHLDWGGSVEVVPTSEEGTQ